MWYLTSRNGTTTYLVGKDTFSVGRRNTDIIIQKDESISRYHAEITLRDGKLFIMDLGSKYGTYLGTVKFQAEQKYEIKNNNEVKFGALNSIYRFTEFPIYIYRSNIDLEQKNILVKHMNYLNGTVLKEWSSLCTHLVTSPVKLTSKVLCALVDGKPIVNIAFWDEFVKAVDGNLKLPNPAEYLPSLNEALLSTNVPLVYKPERKTLFQGKVFTFFSNKIMQGIQDVIHIAGGKAILWKKNADLNLDLLENTNPEYIIIQDYDKEFESESAAYQNYNNIITHLRSIGKRAIPSLEIPLAMLFCSCEKNCNPNFDKIKTLVSAERPIFTQSQVLAPESEYVTPKIVTSTQKSISETPMESTNLSPLKNISQEQTQNKEIDDSMEVFESENKIESEKQKQMKTVDKLKKNMGSSKSTGDIEVASCSKKRSSDETDATVVSKRFKETIETLPEKETMVDNIKVNPFSSFKPKKRQEKPQMSGSETEASSCDSKSIVVNPFTKKRKAQSDLLVSALTDVMKRPAKKEKIVHEESSFNPKDVLSSTRVDEFTNEKENISTVTCKTEKNSTDTSVIVPVTGWISKKNCSLKKSNVSVANSTDNKENNEETVKWMESFTNKIIVEFKKLEVEKPKNFEVTTNGGKNFKKFRKVAPRHYQTYIVPKTSYTVVICGKEDIRTFSDDEDDGNLSDYDDNNTRNARNIFHNINKTTNSTTSTKKFNFGAEGTRKKAR